MITTWPRVPTCPATGIGNWPKKRAGWCYPTGSYWGELNPLTSWLFVLVEWFLIRSPKEGNISVGMFFWKRLTVFVWEILKNDNIITLWMLDCSIALMLDFWKREDIGNYDKYALLTIPCLPTGTMECWRPLTGGWQGSSNVAIEHSEEFFEANAWQMHTVTRM